MDKYDEILSGVKDAEQPFNRPGPCSSSDAAPLNLETLRQLVRELRQGQTELEGAMAQRTEDLRQTQEQFRIVSEHAADLVWLMGFDFKFTFLTDACESLLGYERNALESLPLDAWLSPAAQEQLSRAARKRQEIERSGTPTTYLERLELEHYHKTGRRIWLEVLTTPFRNAQGDLDGLVGVCRDISERRHMEEERTLLYKAIEQAAELMVVANPDGRIRYVNPAAEIVTGYSRHELIGRNPRIFKSGKTEEKLYRELWDTLRAGRTWSGRFINRRKDGSLYHEDAVISPVLDESGGISCFFKVGRDVSRLLELEQQLVQAQKVEALGMLAGGIAHDFNNILTASVGFLELALDEAAPGSALRSNLEEVMSAMRRANELVQRILTLSRRKERAPQCIRLQPILSEALALLRASLPADISITLAMEDTCGCVYADAGEIHQVVMNLCTNAFHAMRDKGGTLAVSLEPATYVLDLTENSPVATPRPCVRLALSDTGRGMDAATIANIYEPFFTTKSPGEGTGLGLATVRNIVRSCGGVIEVESEIGKGTTFILYLPVCGHNEHAEQPVACVQSPLFGNERILFVDDEEMICRLMKTALERFGYQVVAFSDSRKALEAFQETPDHYDIVVTDLVMPGLSGMGLAAEIKRLRPDKAVVLCSGMAEEISEINLNEAGVDAFLEKPLFDANLVQTMRKLLDSRS